MVERDGALIMVDDERMPLQPGETPQMRAVRFRTLGCYPLTGAIESDAATLAGHHRGDAWRRARPSARAASSTTTARLDGEEEAGRLFLMAGRRRSALDALR